MKKPLIIGLSVTLLVLIATGLYFKRDIQRAHFVASLFNGQEQYQTFGRLAEIFPVSTMSPSPSPYTIAQGTEITLPKHFSYDGTRYSSEQFISDTDTSALLVIHQGKIRFERYWLSGGPDVNWLSMSVAKSFIATGIGIAVGEGFIDVQKPIIDYLPSLKDSAYDQATVEHVLQMSSGAAWNEDYSNPDSDVLRLGRIMAMGGSLDEFVPSLISENTPGTVNHYNSADTQALGMLLAAATGRSVTDYLQEKVWHPLGMNSPGYWLIDDFNVEMAFGGLNATARDYAKLGELYRLNGLWQGKQLLSPQWIEKSTTVQAPHLRPGIHELFPLGYGYQWWIPEGEEGEYSAIGVYNQFIYVNPSRDLVIVKLSANSEYGTTEGEASNKEMATFELLRAIAQQFPAH
ncbi:serine hydrolase [uncultured Pseudoteredinibacter sp.]|uniref:serine hydrolase domain-containing protein n=1 Tax=uncultured Pseudoteredinibacter sp. TaxID=1641701 RepID=UPI00261C18C8|nr:serine hydrolase [uncultured Pseudoteredinibacter sp.]